MLDTSSCTEGGSRCVLVSLVVWAVSVLALLVLFFPVSCSSSSDSSCAGYCSCSSKFVQLVQGVSCVFDCSVVHSSCATLMLPPAAGCIFVSLYVLNFETSGPSSVCSGV